MLKCLGLVNNLKEYQIVEENISQTFRLKNIEETRNSFIKEVDQNVLMSKKQKSL